MVHGTREEMLALLEDIEGMLRREQEMLGDQLLYEQSTIPHTMTKQPVKPVLLLPAEVSVEPSSTETWSGATSLGDLDSQICSCTKCPLGHTRNRFVFGVGNPEATVMLIGEAPGADEDVKGEPFVGRAGQLLNKILEAIQFKREDVYICNILKCRPPNNRTPQPEEVEQCIPYLKKQIALVRPRVILCLGLTAARNLLGTNESLTSLRGRVMKFEGIPLMVTYHPAALLRNPNWKRPAWDDVRALRKLHDELTGTLPGIGEDGTGAV